MTESGSHVWPPLHPVGVLIPLSRDRHQSGSPRVLQSDRLRRDAVVSHPSVFVVLAAALRARADLPDCLKFLVQSGLCFHYLLFCDRLADGAAPQTGGVAVRSPRRRS
jgi:hypothetical protein